MCTGGWAGVLYVITKFSLMDSLPTFLTHGAPLRARFVRARAPLLLTNIIKNWILFLDFFGNSEADLGKGPGGPGPPLYFWTKLRPERSKKNFKKAPPYLWVWMTAPPLILRSESATAISPIATLYLVTTP